MKKVYEKPEIVFDCFTLSTNIAAGCKFKTNLQVVDATGCGYGDRTGVIFTSAINCEYQEVDGDYNGICYHVPTGNSLFNS